ncbi:multidrug transporter AcrB [Pleomorphomonas diazotrophica]|uniref:Multidrug transporter AcrB n=1 Tax=Pleomorphomonas diazotrophica TaxID=1166257 RepID=A0A1I4WP69_9HYPH|nr:efflux RND transporter permease subunit [Pleomorphomonas diazotrophica]PKR87185.1 multidrug transporter AcrB [Pleomorphomonas diazotrophica]SFN14920.1 hydrophobic/amphiphilic exporter-1, HAE1 family [Pleomorphomonas diazotrophica]
MSGRSHALTALFVRRPVLALVVNALVVVAGLAAYRDVEVRELPDVDRPVVTVTVGYDGAAPETIDTDVTARVESAVSRVAGVTSISGRSSFGRSRVTIEFSENTDLNVAANDTRDVVSRIRNQLPDGIDEPQIVKADADGDAIIRIAVTSDRVSLEELTSLVNDRIADALAAVDGVADVQVFGDQEPVFRVDIDQTALAARGLTVADLTQTLSTVSMDSPAGSLANRDLSLVVRADARVTDAAGMARLMINGTTRLGDVATVSLAPDTGTSQLKINGKAGIGMGIVRAARSNSIQISNDVARVVASLKPTLPDGVDLAITSDEARFINGALHEVILALGLGVVIVVAVIYLFLANWRATLIPAITIPVSLIGTLAAMWLIGFSINIVTLLALVLATGLVVDDAIVVLENIVRRRHMGMRPRAAAVLGTEEVFFAVLATTATLAAVFVPISFLPGTAGSLFREFGFVLAISVTISGFTALTFAPMLAATILPAEEKQRQAIMPRLLGAIGRPLAALYGRLLDAALAAPIVVVVTSLAFAAVAWGVFQTLPNELTPREDRGSVMLSVTAPPGISIDNMGRQMDKVAAVVQPYLDSGEATASFAIAGRGDTNSGFMMVTLAPWEERSRGQAEIAAEINGKLAAIPSIQARAMSSNSLGIRGGGQGLRLSLVGPDFEGLAKVGDAFIRSLEARPEVRSASLDYQPTQPQLSVRIDRDRAQDLGIPVTGLAQALQSVLDGREVADVSVGDRIIPVKLVSSATPIDDPTDLGNVFLRTGDGRMVPMSAIATLVEGSTAPGLSRDGQQRAVPISIDPAPGVALRQAMAVADEVASSVLPAGYGIKQTGEAAALAQTSSGLATTFGFALIVVLLVLAAQFESFVAALIIIATVPFGLAAAVFAIRFTGGTLNIYSQIGLVMVVGIMAKNGILIVEFANQLRDEGRSVREAIETAARIRLRPVVMTMIATIVGAVPLVLAFGAGAEARVALGWVLVGGLGFATVFTLFLTPVAYLMLARFAKPRGHVERLLSGELAAAAALGLTEDEPAGPTKPKLAAE